MAFLLSLTVLHWIVLVQCFHTMQQALAGAGGRNERMLSTLGMLTSAGLMGFPLVSELLTVAAFSDGKPISIQGDYLPLWFLGAGGALALVVFGLRLARQRKHPGVGFFAVGANAAGLAIGLYMMFVVADQLAFFAPPREDAGMLNWGLVRQQGLVNDIQCDSDLLVVKGIESDEATYRCPHEGLVVMGRFTGTPIVPWPSYTEGSSHQLATEVRKMHRSAVKVEDAVKEAGSHH